MAQESSKAATPKHLLEQRARARLPLSVAAGSSAISTPSQTSRQATEVKRSPERTRSNLKNKELWKMPFVPSNDQKGRVTTLNGSRKGKFKRNTENPSTFLTVSENLPRHRTCGGRAPRRDSSAAPAARPPSRAFPRSSPKRSGCRRLMEQLQQRLPC